MNLSTDQLRDAWATIAAMLASEFRGDPRAPIAARMALEFALDDDPPAEWPEFSAGWYVLRDREGGYPSPDPVEHDGPPRLVAQTMEMTWDREFPNNLLEPKGWPPMPAMSATTGQHGGVLHVTETYRLGPRTIRLVFDLADLAQP
jgi:hypothetical protein